MEEVLISLRLFEALTKSHSTEDTIMFGKWEIHVNC